MPLWKGELNWGKEKNVVLTLEIKGKSIQKKLKNNSKEKNLQILLQTIREESENPNEIDCIGHRVVHGGSLFEKPTLITSEVKKHIKELIPLAPLHNPESLQAIELMEKLFPGLPQIAVFDTAFHSTIPSYVNTYPVPYEWKKERIQRYGFHGISHHYCAEKAANMLDKKMSDLNLINCHLGNGCSLCVIKGGKSVDTTMGMTPMEGLMMGTRCGSIDPGIMIYLLNEKKMTADELNKILNFESGLKGICGFSDMREVLKAREKQNQASLAFDMFIYHLKTYIGAMRSAWGPMDAISFTAGIGENAWQVREKVCEGLDFMGAKLDLQKNKDCRPDQDIALDNSKMGILVIHTEEEWMIAKACFHFLIP